MTGLRVGRAVDALLEASVVGSFTRVGCAVRRRVFDWPAPDSYSLDGRFALVTGATSGIGRAVADLLVRQGARVCVVGRDRERTDRARDDLVVRGAEVEAEVADLALLSETAGLAERVARRHDALDVLVLNAGALNRTYAITTEGNELTLAVHVLSPFLLLEKLRPLLERAAPARVVVVSSGGMYTQALDLAGLVPTAESYDGAVAYARCKRAQVALVQEWAPRLLDAGVVVNAMHPGWADTPGLRHGLPGFSRIVGPLLRSATEGADTVAWLAAAPEARELTGCFVGDRRPRRTHRLRRTERADEPLEAARLWRFCLERTAPFSHREDEVVA